MKTGSELKKQLEALEKETNTVKGEMNEIRRSIGEAMCEAYSELYADESDDANAELLFSKMDLSIVMEQMKRVKELDVILAEQESEKNNLKAVRICPKCDNIMEEDDLFCPSCGERVLKENLSDNKDNCPHCGMPRKQDALFCVHCGMRFAGNDEKMQQPRKCKKCNAVLEDDAVYCYCCGMRQD